MKFGSAGLTFAVALGFAAAPFLTGGFSGFSPEQFEVPQDNAPIQPAGYAFSIWGLIYIWLIAGAGFGLVKRALSSDWHSARPALSISLLMGSSWIAVAQLSVGYATLLIWGMLFSAVVALLRSTNADRWWLREPIGLYAGWLTAAASVSLGLFLAGYGHLTQTSAAIAGLATALTIAIAVQKARPDVVSYPLAVIWALVGIALSNVAPLNGAALGLSVAGAGYLMLKQIRPAAS